MSYTPTEWVTGDVVTAEKLNKLENGVSNACIAGAIKLVYYGFTSSSHSGGIICHACKLIDSQSQNEYWECFGYDNTFINLAFTGNPTFAAPVNIINTDDMRTYLVFVGSEPDISVYKGGDYQTGTLLTWESLQFGSSGCYGVPITDLSPLYIYAN